MARDPYAVIWLADAVADLIALDAEDEKLTDAVLATIDDIACHRQRGKALGSRNVSGDLSGLLRLRVDTPGQRPQRYRIVFRVVPTESGAAVEIIALGLRADHQIYRQAVLRTVPAPSSPSGSGGARPGR